MIRPIREDDIAQCLAWYNWYIEHTAITFEEDVLSLDIFSARVHRTAEKYPWLILEEEGRPVGYACLDAFNYRSAYRFTADVTIYLDPQKTGNGRGTLLFQALEEEAKRRRFHKLISLVTEGNQASEHLHEKLGYRKAAVIERAGFKFGTWRSVTWYEKDLLDYEDCPAEPDFSGTEIR